MTYHRLYENNIGYHADAVMEAPESIGWHHRRCVTQSPILDYQCRLHRHDEVPGSASMGISLEDGRNGKSIVKTIRFRCMHISVTHNWRIS